MAHSHSSVANTSYGFDSSKVSNSQMSNLCADKKKKNCPSMVSEESSTCCYATFLGAKPHHIEQEVVHSSEWDGNGMHLAGTNEISEWQPANL